MAPSRKYASCIFDIHNIHVAYPITRDVIRCFFVSEVVHSSGLLRADGDPIQKHDGKTVHLITSADGAFN